ncbi:pimeloyl-ACP methyl ester carboxylesterase [Marmoricola sp. URHA0025 HA25]
MTLATAPREHAVELPGLTASVLEWGSSDAPLLVALHGFPDSARTWRRIAPLLADAGWRVVAPFLRGYAPTGSPADGDFSVLAAACDAAALHERLGGDERAVLLGHDWGALAASVLAGRTSSPFDRYVALALPPIAFMNPTRETLPTWTRAVLRQPARSWYIGFNQVPGLAERRFHWLARRLWTAWSPGYDATEDLELLRAAVPDRAHAKGAVSYYRTLVRPASRALAAEPLRPMLYLHGDRDGALDPRFFDVVAARIKAPSAAALVPRTGHFLHLEDPTTVAGHILAFLGSPGAVEHPVPPATDSEDN